MLANIQVEPTSPAACATVMLRRAAHVNRWADELPVRRAARNDFIDDAGI